MTRSFLIIIIAFSVLSGSCSGRKSKAGRRDIIPKKDLIEILTEINIANGLLTLPKLTYEYRKTDTIPVYNGIIAAHGYTRVQMDRTMKYYFQRRPKDMIRIYDIVLGRLSEMESRIDEEMPELRAAEMNIWTGRKSYSFPDPDGPDTTWFAIPVTGPGTYDVKYTLTIYPDDPVANPGPDIYFTPSDTPRDDQRDYLATLPYLKDGMPHTYEMKLVLKEPRGWIKGWFIGYHDRYDISEMHSRIEGIYIHRGLMK